MKKRRTFASNGLACLHCPSQVLTHLCCVLNDGQGLGTHEIFFGVFCGVLVEVGHSNSRLDASRHGEAHKRLRIQAKPRMIQTMVSECASTR
jgi:hypothetical protein